MNDIEKSDSVVVPMKRVNKGDKIPAESVEERTLAKGNTHQPTTTRTQCRDSVSSGLAGVRKAARMHKRMRFTALLHHVTMDQLQESYNGLKRHAAPGIDGITWAEYGKDGEQRLKSLHQRIHQGTYRAKPARRVYIPKADGSQRALSIWCLEDKIVQQALTTVLNAIYESDFLGFSYGFRPGRGQHDALDALSVGLSRRKVNWVLDADIQSFFDHMDHDWILAFLEHRIGDKRVLRLVRKWLTVGVMTEAGRERLERGAPQGAVISPLLANIYLHYVLDLWTQQWRQRTATGDVIVVRYADDFVLGFQHDVDARSFQRGLQERLGKFGLNLHPQKTQLIRFGRFARRDCRANGEGKPPTFDFLGFTHYCTIARTNRRFMVGRKSIKKRMRSQLLEIKKALRKRLHHSVGDTGAWLQRVLRGHLNYYAVPGNQPSLHYFFIRVKRYWLRALRRRSQRHRMNWVRFGELWRRFAPSIVLSHDYPALRFDAKTRGRSPVR
jgi:group II intron reverse transcriptase/maturase